MFAWTTTITSNLITISSYSHWNNWRISTKGLLKTTVQITLPSFQKCKHCTWIFVKSELLMACNSLYYLTLDNLSNFIWYWLSYFPTIPMLSLSFSDRPNIFLSTWRQYSVNNFLLIFSMVICFIFYISSSYNSFLANLSLKWWLQGTLYWSHINFLFSIHHSLNRFVLFAFLFSASLASSTLSSNLLTLVYLLFYPWCPHSACAK